MRLTDMGSRPMPDGMVELTVCGMLTEAEFRNLRGNIDRIRIFPLAMIETPSSVIRTGARHSHAKYFLFPSALRRKVSIDQFDLAQTRCGTFETDGDLYVVFAVPGRGRSGLPMANDSLVEF